MNNVLSGSAVSRKLMLLLGVVSLFSACDKKVKLDNDIKKSSYAIGQQIGKNVKTQGIDIDSEALAMSLNDAIKGTSQMTNEEVTQAMMKLQEVAVKKQTELADKNKKEGAEYLEKNKSQAGVKVTSSGLQYIVQKEGEGKSPTKEDMVKCHYTGTLINGEKFDSSVDRGQPAEFPVGGVIPGWTEALMMMKPGAKYKLFIPPELAYGPTGRPGIPPNSVLIFEVELIGLADKPGAGANPHHGDKSGKSASKGAAKPAAKPAAKTEKE